jgi:hypothetical protein
MGMGGVASRNPDLEEACGRSPSPRGERNIYARTHRRVKHISKYIYQKGENEVKRLLRHISWRMSVTLI